MRAAIGILATMLVMGSVGAMAQTVTSPSPEREKETTKVRRTYMCEVPSTCSVQTIYLANVSQVNDGNEITTALRNLLPPETKIYLVPAQNALVIQADAEVLARAQKLINDLDRPRKSYRLTFTITELEGTRRIGTQHSSIAVVSGQRTTMKQGSKIPVVTGMMTAASTGTQTQMTYLDVGMNFDVTFTETAGGGSLKAKLEQSGVAEEKSAVGTQDPIIRQTVLDGVSALTLGKPLMLGSVDISGSTRHLDVEVMVELVK